MSDLHGLFKSDPLASLQDAIPSFQPSLPLSDDFYAAHPGHDSPSHSLFNLSQNQAISEVPLKRMRTSTPLFSVLDEITGKINHAGAVLGLASLICSFIGPLRPLSAAGVGLLSNHYVAGTLLISGAYSLYRQAPYAWSAASRLFHDDPQGSGHSRIEDVLQVGGFGLGALGIGVGVASFGVAAKNYTAIRHQLLQEGVPALTARRMAFAQADATRRAFQDPELWVQFARSYPSLTPFQRQWMSLTGRGVNHALLGGSAVLGTVRLGWGIKKLYENHQKTGETKVEEVGDLFLGFAQEVMPGLTIYLYRAGRGDRRFNLGPALSQELSEAVYRDPQMRSWVLQKLDKSIPPLPPTLEQQYVTQSHQDLNQVATLLQAAENLPSLSSLFPSTAYQHLRPVSEIPQRISKLPEGEPGGILSTQELGSLSLLEWNQAYSSQKITPLSVLKGLLEDPIARNGALFPRPFDRGVLGRRLKKLARESTRRFQEGNPRPLEGIFVPVKDLFPGVDGVMNTGSKTTRIAGVEMSPLVQTLLEMGAIPIPVGMTAAANGGSGLHSSYGYIPHPHREGYDPAGSSSATAFLVGSDHLPFPVSIVTGTGGSEINPAGAVGLACVAPPQGVLSTKNMVPLSVSLDRPAVLAKNIQDGMTMARYLARAVGDDPHYRFQNPGMLFQPSPQRPVLVYLEKLFRGASPAAQFHFQNQIEKYRQQGYEVIALDSRWDFLAEVPFLLYPLDAYPGTAFTHTNPLQRNLFEPPRRVLDHNLLLRLPKAGIAIRFGLFDKARDHSAHYQKIVTDKVGEGFVWISPSSEAIMTAELLQGKAGPKLDAHDRNSMAKHRIPDWGQINLPACTGSSVGIACTGSLPDLMHLASSSSSP